MIGNPVKNLTPQTSTTATNMPTGVQSSQRQSQNTLMMVVWTIVGIIVLLLGWGYIQRWSKLGKEKIQGQNVAVNWHNMLILAGFYIVFVKGIPAAMALLTKYNLPGTKWLGTLFSPNS